MRTQVDLLSGMADSHARCLFLTSVPMIAHNSVCTDGSSVCTDGLWWIPWDRLIIQTAPLGKCFPCYSSL
jgi:hypothetical protein